MPGCTQAHLADTSVEGLTGCRIKQYINKPGSLPQRSHRHIKTQNVDGKASFRTSKTTQLACSTHSLGWWMRRNKDGYKTV